MKHRFRRVISALSAVALMGYAVPMAEFAVFAEEMTEEISDDVMLESSFDELNISSPTVLAAAPENTISRGEWIHDLVNVFQISIEDDSTMEYYYTDISDSQYAYDINLASNYGVFDVESDTFNPEQAVTREFAAHTANYCMGYLDDGTSVNISDLDEIDYDYDVIVSVQKGWLALSSDKFHPDNYISSTEADNILTAAKEAVESTKIDSNAENKVVFSDSVIQLDESVNVSYFEGKVTLYDTTGAVSVGRVFTVTIEGSQYLFKGKRSIFNVLQ